MSEATHQANGEKDQAVISVGLEKLHLDTSSTNDLQLARVITRKAQSLVFAGYSSDQDDSEEDEEDGKLQTITERHENGNMKYLRTYLPSKDASGKTYERLVEEKHFDPDGIVRIDNHFALGQPYLYRKHYHATQQLKSESVFWVEDEVTMSCKKTGHWRTYYENGSIKSEIQYRDGIRFGFCKRYSATGSIEWVKDYTRDYQQRIDKFNQRKGCIDFSLAEACKVLDFVAMPASMKEVNSQYRAKCAPVHPDKTPDPDATEVFIRISRARDVLKDYFEKKQPAAQAG